LFLYSFWYDFSYFIYFFIVGEILQPSGGHVQGKGILIAGMTPDLSYDNTRSERLNFWGNEMKIKQEAQLMLTTGSTRLAVNRGQQTCYHCDFSLSM